ncbi:hypothetical protein [Rhodococcus sp. NPDC127528]|uniref:hypothetical protein n=1 Tax=unclassified Rhodococcus (in: high G+C Gram-positive bacteria) TaxID=192944 RepID=UPI003629FBA1
MAGSVPVVAGALSTAVFVASTMPMILKAIRTRDLSSYSGGNLILSNAGNLLYAAYVFSLPVGPAWALYCFNLSVGVTMLALWLRYRAALQVSAAGGAVGHPLQNVKATSTRIPIEA